MMLKICKNLFDKWNNHVRYCHWKSNEHLLEGLQGVTDLDVFVLPDDKELAEEDLKSCRYIQFRPQKGSRYPNVDEWMGFDEDSGRLVHVHLHYQIITGTKHCKEYVFPVETAIIQTCEVDKNTGVKIASPNIEIIILFCRIALKATNKRKISSKSYNKEIAYLKEHIDSDKVQLLCTSLIGKGAGEEMFRFIEKNALERHEWYEIYKIAKQWLKPYRLRTKTSVTIRFVYYKIRNKTIKILNKKLNKSIVSRKTLLGRAPIITFLGQDGSGKSTLSNDICKWLNWKIEAKRFYLGSGEHYNSFYKCIAKHFSNSTTHTIPQVDNKRNNSNGKKGTYFNNIKSNIGMIVGCYNLLRIAKRAYKQMLIAYNYSLKGGIPIFDRYPQIQFEGIYDGPKIKTTYLDNGRACWFVRYIHRKEETILKKAQDIHPNIVFKLLLPPEESIRRKPMEKLEVVAVKHEITKQLIFPNSEVVCVDATQSYEEELLQIKRIIWDQLLTCK